MIIVQFNDAQLTLEHALSLEAFLKDQRLPEKNFALLLNDAFVSRERYATVILSDQDTVQLIYPMQGG